MARVGPSWWYAYRNGSAVGKSADAVKTILLIVGVAFSLAAPLMTDLPIRRRMILAFAALLVVLAAYYLSGLVAILFIYGA
jgi:hypothetical protein